MGFEPPSWQEATVGARLEPKNMSCMGLAPFGKDGSTRPVPGWNTSVLPSSREFQNSAIGAGPKQVLEQGWR